MWVTVIWHDGARNVMYLPGISDQAELAMRVSDGKFLRAHLREEDHRTSHHLINPRFVVDFVKVTDK